MGQHGEINLGQLARERYHREVRFIGFTTFAGSVTAASDWDEPPQHMTMLPALPASYEALLHTVGLERFMLSFEDEALCAALTTSRLERAIGVIYRPDTERLSHYFTAQLCKQFDIVLHIDRTHALEPLETWAQVEPATCQLRVQSSKFKVSCEVWELTGEPPTRNRWQLSTFKTHFELCTLNL
jgi:erythromycin esterase-like protein